MSQDLYDISSQNCSKVITHHYSTSFSMGIRTLHKRFRTPIYSIYGFVRLADEIVDSFHKHDKKYLLDAFRNDTYEAIERGISLNPILQAFQIVVNRYGIERDLIDAFLFSMEMDLSERQYDTENYHTYIYGSAEVVGLMCLKVFVEGDQALYEDLKESAQRLGAAFQKVNFLRDIQSDYRERGRTYFPGVNFEEFHSDDKELIQEDIKKDLIAAYKGIVRLPRGARKGVYLAYVYYSKLFLKIQSLPASRILDGRIRIPDFRKFMILIPVLISNNLSSPEFSD